MAAAITTPAGLVQMGKPLVIAGTGFAATHAVTIVVAQLGITLNVTSDASGNVTSTAVATITPVSDVPLDITISDGTSTVSAHWEVSTN